MNDERGTRGFKVGCVIPVGPTVDHLKSLPELLRSGVSCWFHDVSIDDELILAPARGESERARPIPKASLALRLRMEGTHEDLLLAWTVAEAIVSEFGCELMTDRNPASS